MAAFNPNSVTVLMNSPANCIFIFDSDFRLLMASETSTMCDCWHDALIFKDNQLVGIKGVSESIFRESILQSVKEKSTFFLKPKKKHRLTKELIVSISPLYDKSSPSKFFGPSNIQLEIQTLDRYYSTTTKRLADKFDLTPTERVVLSHLLNGLTSSEIKQQMDIGDPTLRSHQQRIRSKFGENSVTKTILSALKIENNVDKVIEMDD